MSYWNGPVEYGSSMNVPSNLSATYCDSPESPSSARSKELVSLAWTARGRGSRAGLTRGMEIRRNWARRRKQLGVLVGLVEALDGLQLIPEHHRYR